MTLREMISAAGFDRDEDMEHLGEQLILICIAQEGQDILEDKTWNPPSINTEEVRRNRINL